jgi:hypothetical protein
MAKKKKKTTNKKKTSRSQVNQTKSRIQSTGLSGWIFLSQILGGPTEKQFNRMKLASPVNEGWLYNKDKHAY